jgi:hypothetical protein
MRKTKHQDRRQQERFALKASSIVLTADEQKKEAAELYTRDISARGAFFATDKPLEIGASVSITIFLIIAAVEKFLGQPRRVRITTEGTVVRNSAEGMGVVFGRHYRLEPVEQR